MTTSSADRAVFDHTPRFGERHDEAIGRGLVGILGAGALGACGDDDDTTASTVGPVAQANAAFCQDLAAYGTALGSLIALDPATATKADYSAAVDDVTSAREEMVSAGKDLTEAEWTNLQTQVEDLTGTLKDAPDDVTVSSILSDANAQAATVQASVASLNTAVCTGANTTTTTTA